MLEGRGAEVDEVGATDTVVEEIDGGAAAGFGSEAWLRAALLVVDRAVAGPSGGIRSGTVTAASDGVAADVETGAAIDVAGNAMSGRPVVELLGSTDGSA